MNETTSKIIIWKLIACKFLFYSYFHKSYNRVRLRKAPSTFFHWGLNSNTNIFYDVAAAWAIRFGANGTHMENNKIKTISTVSRYVRKPSIVKLSLIVGLNDVKIYNYSLTHFFTSSLAHFIHTPHTPADNLRMNQINFEMPNIHRK